jgi:hypothetical protein
MGSAGVHVRTHRHACTREACSSTTHARCAWHDATRLLPHTRGCSTNPYLQCCNACPTGRIPEAKVGFSGPAGQLPAIRAPRDCGNTVGVLLRARKQRK